MSGARRGGIPGPESRTGLVRPTMTEAEFERRQGGPMPPQGPGVPPADPTAEPGPGLPAEGEPVSRVAAAPRGRTVRAKPAKPRRVQRMFALEEELDKKLWLYAIHVGKDRSEVVNDLLRPIVASMVLYDSRDRRAARAADQGEPEGEAA
jgi:hypothetical protein